MILNGLQYRVTKAQAQMFLKAYYIFSPLALEKENISPILIESEKKFLLTMYRELAEEVKDYEILKSGEIKSFTIRNLEELPITLIKARIASGLNQAQLAEKLGMKTQMIQRYESSNYANASFRRLIQIAEALNIKFDILLRI